MMALKDLHAGLLVRDSAAKGFKVLVVLGDSKAAGKVRVATWSENQRKWSCARTAHIDKLEPLGYVKDSLCNRKRLTISHALSGCRRHPAGDMHAFAGPVEIAFGDGAIFVGRMMAL